jgi:hypothetical protein
MKANRLAVVGAACFALSSVVFAQCGFGWILKYSKVIGIGETLCVYEKNGVQQQFIVKGFCPMTPPGC